MARACLLTGAPGTGKTSLIKEAIAGMAGAAGGFYTEEIREGNMRKGFRIVTLAGESVILAHTDIRGPYRVGKYGVDVDSLDRVGVPALADAAAHSDLVVIDEIGKMELFSVKFREMVAKLIQSDVRLLATIMLKPHPWADAIKRLPELRLLTLTRPRYADTLAEVKRWLEITAS